MKIHDIARERFAWFSILFSSDEKLLMLIRKGKCKVHIFLQFYHIFVPISMIV